MVARWIASNREPSHSVLRALGQVLMAVADETATEARLQPASKGDSVNQQDAARATDDSPRLSDNATPDEIQLWLADTRTRAHRLIDESVTAAQEALNRRNAAIDEGDATAQAQRHAQRLAVERLRRAIGDLTLEIRGVHGRLDRLESLVRAAVEAPRVAPAPTSISAPPASIATAASVAMPAAPAAPSELRAAVAAASREPERAAAAEDVRATVVARDLASENAQPVVETPGLATEARLTATAPESALVGPTAETAVERPEGPTVGAEASPAPSATSLTASAPAVEPQPAPGFAAEARAAVEAAVASALLEARRAASARSQQTERETEATESPGDARTPLVEARTPAPEAPAPTWPRLATPEPATEAPAAELAGAPSAELAEATQNDEPVQPAPSVEPLTRPSLWVPPSAIAPPRPVQSSPSTPAFEQEPVREAVAPQPLPRPAATTLAPAMTPEPVAPTPAPAPEPAPSMAPAATRPAPVAAGGVESRFASAPAATVERLLPAGLFEAGDGPVVLRIAPISGFQGLMRVQDAVVQHGPVREATVEAYARGEARLRLQLASTLDAEQLASALVRSLGLQARIESVSDEERSIQVTLA